MKIWVYESEMANDDKFNLLSLDFLKKDAFKINRHQNSCEKNPRLLLNDIRKNR